MNTSRRFASLVVVATFLLAPVFGAENAGAKDDYAAVAAQRADKIVETLKLDQQKVARVRETIARQYRDLNAIHSSRDAKIAAAKTQTDVTARDAGVAGAKAEADKLVSDLHPQYLARLAADLTPEQIDQVKDGMTYGVLPLTYRVYQQMLPDLTPEQKKQIYDWLVEARELAMDGGSSHEKHAWFGKYKGKINNYLSKAGIDMKKAEKNLKK